MEGRATLHGARELSAKLVALGREAPKALRLAAKTATDPVLAKMIAAAPVGSREHRTYKGRLVAPGFLKRAIKRVIKVRRGEGKVSVMLGVRSEAFYGVQFVDVGRGRSPVAKPFFRNVFTESQNRMERAFVDGLRAAIAKVAAKTGR